MDLVRITYTGIEVTAHSISLSLEYNARDNFILIQVTYNGWNNDVENYCSQNHWILYASASIPMKVCPIPYIFNDSSTGIAKFHCLLFKV